MELLHLPQEEQIAAGEAVTCLLWHTPLHTPSHNEALHRLFFKKNVRVETTFCKP